MSTSGSLHTTFPLVSPTLSFPTETVYKLLDYRSPCLDKVGNKPLGRRSPIHDAAATHQAQDLARILKDASKDPAALYGIINGKDRIGLTPLHSAILNRAPDHPDLRLHTIRLLLDNGARSPSSCSPTENTHYSGIPDRPHLPYLENKRVCTEFCIFADPLTYACAFGDEAVVQLLLAKGAHSGLFELRHQDRESVWIPFCAAVESEHFQLAWQLLEIAPPERRGAAVRHLRGRQMGGRAEGWVAVRELVRVALEAEGLRGGAGYALGMVDGGTAGYTFNNNAGVDGFQGGAALDTGMGLHSPLGFAHAGAESLPVRLEPGRPLAQLAHTPPGPRTEDNIAVTDFNNGRIPGCFVNWTLPPLPPLDLPSSHPPTSSSVYPPTGLPAVDQQLWDACQRKMWPPDDAAPNSFDPAAYPGLAAPNMPAAMTPQTGFGTAMSNGFDKAIFCSQLTANDLGPTTSYAPPPHQFNNAQPNSFNTPSDNLSITLTFDNTGTLPTPVENETLGAMDLDLPDQLLAVNQSQDPFGNSANIGLGSSFPEDGFLYNLSDFLRDTYMGPNKEEGAQQQSWNPSEGVPGAPNASQYEHGAVPRSFNPNPPPNPFVTAESTFPPSLPAGGQFMGTSAPPEHQAHAQEAHQQLRKSLALRQPRAGRSTNSAPSKPPANNSGLAYSRPSNAPPSAHRPSNTSKPPKRMSNPPERKSPALFDPDFLATLQREYAELESYVNSPPVAGWRKYPRHMHTGNGTSASYFKIPELEPSGQAVFEAVMKGPPMRT